MNKKGSEKPIEIFIALFVVLAVAMVLLNMFGDQVASQGEQLQRLADENKLQQVKSSIDTKCQTACQDVGTTLGKAKYCQMMIEGLDLNDNGFDDDYIENLGLVGTCEDQIPCTTFHECRELNIQQCQEILCKYYTENLGLADSKADERLKMSMNPGICYDSLDETDREIHWYGLIVDDVNDTFDDSTLKVTCS